MWGEGYGDRRTYYDPNQGTYISRSRNCAFTRMEAMQSELTGILTDLPDETKIGLQAFSTSGRANNKSWQPSEQRLVTISEPGMRDSSIAFVNTLDDPYPTEWGVPSLGRNSKAFDDEEVILCTFYPMENPTEILMVDIGRAKTTTTQQIIMQNKTKIGTSSSKLIQRHSGLVLLGWKSSLSSPVVNTIKSTKIH